jgi:hypothetical protein
MYFSRKYTIKFSKLMEETYIETHDTHTHTYRQKRVLTAHFFQNKINTPIRKNKEIDTKIINC